MRIASVRGGLTQPGFRHHWYVRSGREKRNSACQNQHTKVATSIKWSAVNQWNRLLRSLRLARPRRPRPGRALGADMRRAYWRPAARNGRATVAAMATSGVMECDSSSVNESGGMVLRCAGGAARAWRWPLYWRRGSGRRRGRSSGDPTRRRLPVRDWQCILTRHSEHRFRPVEQPSRGAALVSAAWTSPSAAETIT